MSNFRPINHDTDFLLPPSVDEWLPEPHLARFVVEIIDGLPPCRARADSQDIPAGMSIPEELARRESRLAAIAEAKAKIEARAGERLAREQAEHQSKLAARAEQDKRTGKKPGGRPPESRPPAA